MKIEFNFDCNIMKKEQPRLYVDKTGKDRTSYKVVIASEDGAEPVACTEDVYNQIPDDVCLRNICGYLMLATYDLKYSKLMLVEILDSHNFDPRATPTNPAPTDPKDSTPNTAPSTTTAPAKSKS